MNDHHPTGGRPRLVPVGSREFRRVYSGVSVRSFAVSHRGNFRHFAEGGRLEGVDENFHDAMLSAQAPIARDR